MHRLKFILQFLIPYWPKALLSIVFNLLAAIFSVFSVTMAIPFLGILFSTQSYIDSRVPLRISSEAILQNFNYLIGKLMIERGKPEALLFIILLVAFFTILKNLFLYIGKTYIIHIRTNVVKDIRNKLVNKILEFDLSYFSFQKRGDIMSKMTIDVKEIEISIINSLEIFFKDPILFFVYLYVLAVMSFKLTLIIMIIFPISVFSISQIGKSMKRVSLRGQRKMGTLMGIFEEILRGIKLVKAYGVEESFKNRFSRVNHLYTNVIEKSMRQRSLAAPFTDLVSVLTILIIMWIGGRMVFEAESTLTSHAFIGYLVVFTQIISPARSFSNGLYSIVKGLASIERIETILNFKYSISNNPCAKRLHSFRESIQFKNVSFQYLPSQEIVLSKINLTIMKGQTIAIVGQSGSGKSTLVDLLPRFYDPNEGEILIDNINLKNYKIEDVRKLIGYVNQQPILFNDTIFNNIVFGKKNVQLKDVENAARLANAHEFIRKRKHSYQTNVGVDGNNLSMGEKQRISIARAILQDTPILILDEATSSLDHESELAVREAISNLLKDRTALIIAHRLATVKNVHKIVVIDGGKIIEQGTHDELILNNKIYNKLVKMEIF
ncbi:MAG: ABC transporter ATP-binding protein [Bacteroidales bacterium]